MSISNEYVRVTQEFAEDAIGHSGEGSTITLYLEGKDGYFYLPYQCALDYPLLFAPITPYSVFTMTPEDFVTPEIILP